MDIGDLLFYITATDAGVILVMGIVSAGIILLDIKADIFWSRVVPATVALALTSIGAGLVLWGGDKLFH